MATVEERLTDLEWRLRYHKIATIILALFLLVALGSRAWEHFHGPGELTVKELTVVNDEGKKLVALSTTVDGEGVVSTFSPEGKELVALGTTVDGEGVVSTFSPEGKELVALGVTVDGEGVVSTFSPEGKELVALGTTVDGEGGVWTTTKSGRSKRLD